MKSHPKNHINSLTFSKKMGDIDLADELDIGAALKDSRKQHEIEHRQQQLHEAAQKKKQETAQQVFQNNTYIQFFKKYQIAIFIILIILAAVLPRMYYAQIPVADDWAYNVAKEDTQNRVAAMIEERYPFLSAIKRAELIDAEVKKELARPEIVKAKEDFANQLRDNYKDPSGTTYLYEADPYYYYSAIKEKNFDLDEGFVWIGISFNKLVKFVRPNADLFEILGYLPIFFTIINGILLWLLVSRVSNKTIGFIAASFFVINPHMIAQTLIGLVDKQSVNLSFMIAITFFTFMAIEYLFQKKYVKGCLSALGIIPLGFFFSKIWNGYFIIFLIMASGIVLTFTYLLTTKLFSSVPKKKKIFWFLILLLILSLMTLSFKEELLHNLPPHVQRYLNIYDTEKYIETNFPNGFKYIEELQPLNFTQLLPLVGGKIFLIIMLLGCILFMRQQFKKEETKWENLFFGFTFFIWLAAFFIISNYSKRFFLYLFIPLSFFLAYGFYQMVKEIFKQTTLYFHAKQCLFQVTLWIFIISVVLTPGVIAVLPSYHSLKATVPIVDDAIYQGAMILKEQTPKNATINVWWDKGYAVRALAERDTLLAASPAMPMTYWQARALVTTNENISKNINRFLNCHQDIYERAKEKFMGKDTDVILNTYLSKNTFEERKAALVKEGFDNKTIGTAAYYLECSKNEPYILLTEDLLPAFNGIVTLANWDFEAADARERVKGMDYGTAIATLMAAYNITNQHAQEFYTRINNLDVITDFGLRRTQCDHGKEVAQCAITKNFIAAINTTTAEVLSAKKPQRVFYAEDNLVKEKDYEQFDVNKTLIIYTLDGLTFGILTDNEIADSMFIRLFLLEGTGIENFEKIADIHKFGTKRTLIYKVRT